MYSVCVCRHRVSTKKVDNINFQLFTRFFPSLSIARLLSCQYYKHVEMMSAGAVYMYTCMYMYVYVYTCVYTLYMYVHVSCLGSSVGRALCLEYRVSWVRVPPEAAHFF